MKLSTLIETVNSTQASIDGKHWYPARPMTAENTFLRLRIAAAWRVLTGKSDAIEWDHEAQAVQGVLNNLRERRTVS